MATKGRIYTSVVQQTMHLTRAYIIRASGDLAPAVCSKCGLDKPLSEYYTHSSRSDGALRYRPYCKSCRTKGGRKHWARPAHEALIQAGVQQCKVCSLSKPLTEFYANGCFADGIKKYRSRCKACVLHQAKSTASVSGVSKAAKRSSSPKNFISGILNHATRRKQHLGFDIDLEYLLHVYAQQAGKCAVSGVMMTYLAGSGRVGTNISIDRIDSRNGYVRGNVQFVCDVVNRMKQDLPQSELVRWCRRILEYSE